MFLQVSSTGLEDYDPLDHEFILTTFGPLPMRRSYTHTTDFKKQDIERAKEMLLGIRLSLATH